MKHTEAVGPAQQTRHGVKAVRANISLSPILLDHAQTLVATRGYHGLSDYFQACIRRDAGLESAEIA